MYANIANALDNFFAGKVTGANALQVAWEGVAFLPTAGQPYFAPKLSAYNRVPLGVGPDTFFQETGTYTIGVVFPTGSGKGEVIAQAAEVVAFWGRNMSLTISGQAALVIVSASAAPAYEDGTTITVPVIVQWQTSEAGP